MFVDRIISDGFGNFVDKRQSLQTWIWILSLRTYTIHDGGSSCWLCDCAWLHAPRKVDECTTYVLCCEFNADTMFIVHPLVVFSVHRQSAVPSIPSTASTSSSNRRAFSSNLIIKFLVSGAWWLSVNWLCHHHQWLLHPLHHPFIIVAERVTNALYQTTTNWLNYLLSSFCFSSVFTLWRI